MMTRIRAAVVGAVYGRLADLMAQGRVRDRLAQHRPAL